MLFNERVTTITQDKMIPAIIDGILNSNVLFMRSMLSGAKVWSGENIKKPIKISKSATGGAFSGMAVFDVSATNTRTKLQFEPKAFYQNVTIPGIEKAVNGTDAQVLSLVKVQLEEAQADAYDALGDILYGTGAGDAFEGLGNIVDDGTSIDSYGGLSRATYSQIKATKTAAAGGILTLATMATLMASVAAAGSGRQRPSLGLCDETVWNLYEKLLQPTVSANYSANGYPQVTAFTAPGQMVSNGSALAGTQGFAAVTYRGLPIVADEKANSGVLFFLNELYLNWYRLTDSGLQTIPMGGDVLDGVYKESKFKSPFQWTGWKTPTNQYGDCGQFIAMGNFIGDNPRRQGKLTSITTS